MYDLIIYITQSTDFQISHVQTQKLKGSFYYFS